MTQTSARPCIGIIGAGMTGLTAAHRLLDAGFDVILLESTLQPGGMVASLKFGSEPIEHIYHHIFTSDRRVTDLADEMGLSHDLAWYPSREAVYADGRLYPFTTPLDLLRFRRISPLQRLKTGLAVLKAGRIRDWQPLESQTAAAWLRRVSGSQAYERLWKPLLSSKFESEAEQVSAVWIWNKFKLRGHSREHGSGKSRLGYMRGGFGTLTDRLADSIRERGGQFYFGHTAMHIGREPDENGAVKYRVACVLGDCSTVDFLVDGVIATTSGRQFANIAVGLDLPQEYMKKVRSLRYMADLCMILRLRRSLSPYYWTTICDDLPFVLAVEHTNLTGTDRYGSHVVYLSRYLDASSPLWIQPDGEIFRQFAKGLARLYPDFNPADIIDWRLKRTRFAQPVIACNYSGRMPELDTPEPGVKLAGMAQIYPEDRGMNYAIRLGEDAAEAIARYCREEI